MNELRAAFTGILIVWWAPALIAAFFIGASAIRKPLPETELERRLREDREVVRLDAIWVLPAYSEVRLNEELDRLSRLAFEPSDED